MTRLALPVVVMVGTVVMMARLEDEAFIKNCDIFNTHILVTIHGVTSKEKGGYKHERSWKDIS